MLKVAITGGIASGKSLFLQEIAKHKVPVISADAEIAKMYEDPIILKKIKQEFNLEGQNLKESIKQIVLKDSIKLKILEKILHTALHKKFLAFESVARRHRYKACFFEIPLLFEKKMERRYNMIFNIETPIFLQKRRFLSRKNSTIQDFYRFVSLQFHHMKKRKLTAANNGKTILNVKSKLFATGSHVRLFI